MPRIEIDKMTLDEKLETMEAIWEDLCSRSEVPFFTWHEDILRAREAALERGEDFFEDLDSAKAWIQKQIE